MAAEPVLGPRPPPTRRPNLYLVPVLGRAAFASESRRRSSTATASAGRAPPWIPDADNFVHAIDARLMINGNDAAVDEMKRPLTHSAVRSVCWMMRSGRQVRRHRPMSVNTFSTLRVFESSSMLSCFNAVKDIDIRQVSITALANKQNAPRCA